MHLNFELDFITSGRLPLLCCLIAFILTFFVTRIIDGSPYHKPIEKRTNRKRTEGSHAVVS